MRFANALSFLGVATEWPREFELSHDPLTALDHEIDFAALDLFVLDKLRLRGFDLTSISPALRETMLRMLVIQQLFSLSDEQLVFQLLDRHSFQRFAHIKRRADIPGQATLAQFRKAIVGGLNEPSLMTEIQVQLQRRGYLALCGRVIEPALVPMTSGSETNYPAHDLV